MATVWLSAGQSLRLPDVCVKNGEPAPVRVAFDAKQRPTWAAWLLLFSFWAYVVALLLGTESVPVALPVSERAFFRHRCGQQACAVAIVAGTVALVVGAVARTSAVATTGVVLVLAALAASAVVDARTWVGIRYQAPDQAIIVTRCHPAFAAAVASMLPTRPSAHDNNTPVAAATQAPTRPPNS